MLARRFLYIIAILIGLILVAGIGWSLFQDRLMRMAFVPSVPFAAMPASTAPDYAAPQAWLARPGLPHDPTRWAPAGFVATDHPRAAVFYIAPTTYMRKDRWNAPIDDREAADRLTLFARAQATAFNGTGIVWAPRYRQAAFGVFFAPQDRRAVQALDFAYGDVARAFDAFLAANPTGPIILAGHSQGTFHLLRLLRERVAGKPVAARIAAVYAIGWPISPTLDVPKLGLPGCSRAAEPHCIVAWQSFADPADPKLIDDFLSAFASARPRGGAMLCVNPLTGAQGNAAPASANHGALVPQDDLKVADLTPGLVPARCDARGLLLIGDPPKGFGSYVLPGNNYHAFDYNLFWADLRADAEARLRAFGG